MRHAASISSELQLGVVGFGKLVRDYYLPALRVLEGVQVAAVVDPLSESRRAAKKRLSKVETFADYRAMIEQVRLDGVLVASPPSTHLEIWTGTAGHGIPTFVEKPLLLSSQLSLLTTSNGNLRVMTDFNRRFWPMYNRARELVRQELIGTPIQLEFGLHLDVLRWSSVTAHRLDVDEGGLLHDLGPHAIDLAIQIIGEEPATISAVTSTERWRDDHLQLRLSFRNGCSSICNLAYGDRTREWLVAHGPKGRIRLKEPNMMLHVESNGGWQLPIAWLFDVAAFAYRGLRRSQSMGRASIQGALTAFIRSLMTGTSFNPGLADGLRNARWIAAAARSTTADSSPQQP